VRRTASLSKAATGRKVVTRRALTNLVKITEDDADGIISTQRLKKERRYSLDRVVRESGIKLDR
jgi:hypothetical protein